MIHISEGYGSFWEGGGGGGGGGKEGGGGGEGVFCFLPNFFLLSSPTFHLSPSLHEINHCSFYHSSNIVKILKSIHYHPIHS